MTVGLTGFIASAEAPSAMRRRRTGKGTFGSRKRIGGKAVEAHDDHVAVLVGGGKRAGEREKYGETLHLPQCIRLHVRFEPCGLFFGAILMATLLPAQQDTRVTDARQWHEGDRAGRPRHPQCRDVLLLPDRLAQRAARHHRHLAFLRAHDVQRREEVRPQAVRQRDGQHRRQQQRLHVATTSPSTPTGSPARRWS